MEQTLSQEFETELGLFLESIHLKYNYDFRQYASNSLKRTVVRAMTRMGCPTLKALQEKILHDTGCFDELIQSLTIPVSEMFRDPAYFLGLREKVTPLLRTYPSLKIWVAGCSTGEEVYSLAILLQEEDLLERTILYATDINERRLARAKNGTIGREVLGDASLNYQKSGGKRALSDYYRADASSAKFHSALLQNVVFADHSLVTDAVFSETHLISCRNVLLYFNRELQEMAHGLFHESLCRRGFLGLGSSETLRFSPYSKYFDSSVKTAQIYQKNNLIVGKS